MPTKSFSPAGMLRRFGFRQVRRGAVIVGCISGFMLIIQGLAYQASYATAAEQAQFAKSLASAPALGFLYGDVRNLSAGTNGYMVYRVVGFISLVVAAWALFAVTKLLRGSEDDGRWEVIRAGALTPRAATAQVITGAFGAWCLSFLISSSIVAGIVAVSALHMALSTMLIITLMIYSPALLTAAAGVLLSQLAPNRQRALFFGLVPLFGFFLLRGLANTNTDLHWLMRFTPFGWSELVNPILNLQPVWFLPFLLFAAGFSGLGIWLAGRDLGESVLPASTSYRSRYGLLGSGWQLGLRQQKWLFGIWAIAALTMTSLIASLASIAVNATVDSAQLSKSLTALAGNSDDLKIAFLGAGLVFLAMVLMVMAISVIGAIRGDEAKQYLDNILVQPRRRSTWLASRLLLGFAAILIISLAAGLASYAIALSQDITLHFGNVVATSVCLVGSAGFLIGLGAFIFGLKPRLATAALYVVIGWSFIITLVASAVHLNSAVLHSSLFYYTSFNLAAAPDWKTFAWFMVLGVALAWIGLQAFDRRDITAE